MIQRHGNTYIDPTNYVQYEQMQQDLNMSEQHLREDEDSQDSNREDHSQNEYPDEEENNFSSNKS